MGVIVFRCSLDIFCASLSKGFTKRFCMEDDDSNQQLTMTCFSSHLRTRSSMYISNQIYGFVM